MTNNPELGIETEDIREILQIRRDKLAELRASGLDPYEQTVFDRDTHASGVTGNFEELEGKTVSLAGRIMSKRDMGKASFMDLLDRTGRIQLYIKSDDIGAEEYKRLKKLDIGDIIGVSGEVFRTRKGEISIHVRSLTLLSKSLNPLPEKFHGLKDPDLRYRQRYLDLIMNPETRACFETRSKIVTEIRRFLDERGFMEVETPVLDNIAGGATARPFITHHNALDIDMYVRISLELHLKRLIIGGFEKVYEVGRVFRNEGIDYKHNPEFTLLELYEAYTDVNGMMEITEQLICRCAEAALGTNQMDYENEIISLAPPFRRMTMADAVKAAIGLDMMALPDTADAAKAAAAVGVELGDNMSWGEILYAAFEQKAEETLTQPTFVLDHPVEISPLAKKRKDDPRLTERFELFITSREFANAFTELNDPIDQRERFRRQAELRAAGDDEAFMMDEDFLTALEYGMPPTGGMGLGVDRLVMLLTNTHSMRDVLLFPTMKPRAVAEE